MRNLPLLTLLCLFVTTSMVSAETTPLEKAKAAVQAYFDAILGEGSTLGPNMAMSEAIAAVPEKDQAALQDDYSQISLKAARQTVDIYAEKISAGQDASGATDRMHEIEDALSPDDQQKMKLYYNKVRKTVPKMATAY